MKYYVYISDSKVEMLFPQVPNATKQKVATEYKLDFKVFSASRKEDSTSRDDRICRLEAVVDYIREHENVGTVDHTAPYFGGTFLMQWGRFTMDYDQTFLQRDVDIAEQTVLFTCDTDGVIVGLGGSMRHMIGHTGDSPVHVCHSFGFGTWISDVLKRDQVAEDDVKGDLNLHFIHEACRRRKGPRHRLEFLARRLTEGSIGPYGDDPSTRRVIIGTPLYVAMSEEV